MPKLGMQNIRRDQLIHATFECIHRYGFAGTTIAKVSAVAGLSTGIVSHYFGDKNGLLEATTRRLLTDLGKNARSDKNDPAPDPKERIRSIIEGNFASEQVTPYAVTTWLAFWAQAIHVPSLRRLQKINMRRLRSNLRYWLKQLLPQDKAHFVADGLAAMIDGLWLRGSFSTGGIDTQAASQLCIDYIQLQLAGEST